MIDAVFNYATGHQMSDLSGRSVNLQSSARCRVRVNNNVVVATELLDNPGMSLTNAAASVAMQVCQYYEILLEQLIWIEHYPEETGHEETFDLVYFNFESGRLFAPRWKRITKEEVQQLLQ